MPTLVDRITGRTGNMKTVSTSYGVTTVTNTSVDNAFVETEFKSGVKTPGYFNLLRIGSPIPPTPYTHYVNRLQTVKGNYKIAAYNGEQSTEYTGDLVGLTLDWPGMGLLSVSAALSDAAQRKLSNSMLNNIKDSKVNLVQAFAERAQTAQLIEQSALRMVKMFSALKRGNLSAAAVALGVKPPSKRKNLAFKRRVLKARRQRNHTAMTDALSQGVLEVQYGWRPLLQDIYGAHEAISKRNFSEITLTKSSSVSISDTLVEKLPSAGTYGFGTRTSTVTSVRRMKINYALSLPEIHSLSQVGVSNPALVMWELTPWSFVIDWFLPIGNYLSSLDATLGLRFISGSTSNRYTKKTVARITWNYLGAAKITGYAEAVNQGDGYSRYVMADFPSTSLPTLKSPVSLEHALNAISLLSMHRKSAFN